MVLSPVLSRKLARTGNACGDLMRDTAAGV